MSLGDTVEVRVSTTNTDPWTFRVLSDADPDQETALKADPFVQLKLLDVQELDSRIDTLTHQLGPDPGGRQLRELAARRTRLRRTPSATCGSRSTTSPRSRSGPTPTSSRSRRGGCATRAMIDAGQIKDPKALERMLGELESLHRRINDLEDVEIEVMERLEETQRLPRRAHRRPRRRSRPRTPTLQASYEKTSADLQAQLAAVRRERDTAVDGMPDDLMALYEKLRAQKDGVGAAALRRRECGGCRLTLNASDLGIIAKAPSDEVLRCEECNRILVRTGESGL